jgi:DNA polymerase IV
VTHIIVEKPLTRKDVVDFLKVETLPEGIIMVNDDYPIDCINSRFLLDPLQRRYAVNDPQDSFQSDVDARNTSQSLDASLELKAAKNKPRKGDFIHPDQTPPRSLASPGVDRSRRNSGDASDTLISIGGDHIVESHPAMSPNETRSHEYQDSVLPDDELEEMIKMARTMGDMPVDEEEDDKENERPRSRDTPDESGSEDDLKSRGKKKKKQNALPNQEKYSCMTGGTDIAPESNPNGRTIEVLQQMCDYYGRTRDQWRERSYQTVIGVLKKQPMKITSYGQAFELPGIGDRLAKKIEEIALTDRLRRLENAALEPNDRVLQSFMNIYGVGLDQGWKWVLQGHKTLEDLKRHAHLTENHRLGIEHYEDFLTRIPREEVTALGRIVKTNSAVVDPKVEVIIGGSYRRGAATSGDIDCLLTKPGTSSGKDLLPHLNRLVTRLTEIGFLVAALAVSSETGSKWHGCCVLPGSPKPTWRRIDFLLVPETELGAALIYFTGDDIFNRSIRLLSSRKGWRLNQRGLYKDVMRGPGRVKLNEGSLIEGADEKKIFALLGVPWRPPQQRTCN